MILGDPDGYGRYGHLDVADDGGLVCHECGRSVRHLATHARLAHALTAAIYRERHGLGRSLPLVCPDVAAGMSARAAGRIGTDAWQRFEQSRDPSRAIEASLPVIRGPRRAGVRVRQAPAARQAGRGHRVIRVCTCVVCGAQWCPLRGGRRTRATCGAQACISALKSRQRAEHLARTRKTLGKGPALQ